MTAETSTISCSCSIGGTNVPISGFDVTSGSYGSIGSATMTTSLRRMDELGVDLVAIGTASAQVPIYITVSSDGQLGNVFGGEFMASDWDFHNDRITVHARDFAGVLVDQKRVLTRDVVPLTQALAPLSPGQNLSAAGISTMNRNVSQVVTDIANEFGFAPVVNMQSGTDTKAGAIYGSSDHVFMTIPQSLWSVLNTMARDTGNEVYVTPDKKLVFGPPGAGLTPIQFSWNTQKGPGIIPIADLTVSHKPRRNSTFRVLVISYDPAKAVTTLGRATYVDVNLSSKTVKEGLHSGQDAVAADKALANASGNKQTGSQSTLSHVQLYTFHWDGLTADAANARAAAIATDITKRLFLAQFRIDGYPLLLPTTPFTFTGPQVPSAMAGNNWYVTAYRHSFRIPSGRGGGGGFTTSITGLDIPSVNLASGA